ncbi:type III pantothenate kinase [Kangiella taiwanensis]|uniref:Type III pantothenate kinase n=1 Tax=Kangiella taiwanensis TaxID=1079179 RepID=A0ABP8I551_9GAMM|nr:type III pantothenate kinase [Kangiella taiwanensis]
MYLLLDQGNSRCKYVLTPSLGILEDSVSGYWSNDDFEPSTWKRELEAFKDKQIQRVCVSSVASQERKLWFEALCQTTLNMTPEFAESAEVYVSQTLRKMTNSYDSPKALGVDRWLAMIAGFERSSEGFVVMDAGTALTTDWVCSDGKHRGGHIVAGHRLLQQSLLGETGGIAWSAEHDSELKGDLFGENTSAAVSLGAETMLKGYCYQVVKALSGQGASNELRIYVTGGDRELISGYLQQAIRELKLKHEVIIQPNLVLEGLSHWFSMNN